MLVAEPFKLDQIFHKLGGLNRVALAVSGGSDSTALLRMVHEWSASFTNPPQIFVLTVDHKLRAAAASEAAQVTQWCNALGFSHKILEWQHGGVKSGIQAKARAARYDLMANWCVAHDVPILLTGHTADDQAETVAMRLERTDSVQSIAGIWPARDWHGVQILRPLLKMRRQNLRNYLDEIGQAWIDDPSNDDVQFERVRVRNRLEGNLHRFDEIADAARTTFEQSTQISKIWCAENIQIHGSGFLTVNGNALSKLVTDEFDLVVMRMIELCGQSARGVEREERLNLQTWLRGDKIGRRTLGGALFAKRRDDFLVGREPGRISQLPMAIGQSGTVDWDGRFRLNGPVGASVMPLRDVKDIARWPELPAFVQAGLPAILQNGEIWSIPHLGVGKDVFVTFLRH